MQKDIKELILNEVQLELLSYRTCQWWNAVFVQARRFLDAFDADHGRDPWDEANKDVVLVSERMFFITAIHHAVEYLEKLNIELQRMGDLSLQTVLNSIEKVAPLKDIKNLRNMNEHGFEYLVEKGRNQDQFCSTVIKGSYKIQTNAAWTIVHGDAQTFLFGNVPIDKLLFVMKEQLPLVRVKTKEIFYRTPLGE